MIYAVNKLTKKHRVVGPHSVILMRDYDIVPADADGWIEWDGGECPLPDDYMVETLDRGEQYNGQNCGYARRAVEVDWRKHCCSHEIVKYRPIPGQQAEQVKEWNGEGLPPAKMLQELLSYDPESGLITRKDSGASCAYAVKKKRKTYLKVRALGKSFYAHRVAWAIFHGDWPEGEIDHINGDSEDNCIDNLRVVSRKDNCQNVRLQAESKSGFCGVNWHALSQKWRARVKVDGKEYYVGLFDDPEEAAAAIKKKRKNLGFHDNHGKPHITDRDQWIDEAMEAADCADSAPLIRSYFEAIYDTLASGELEMPVQD